MNDDENQTSRRTPADDAGTAPGDTTEAPQTRAQLVWDVLVFQFKLAADGLRDLILVPISIMAGLLGLIIGGKQPGQYFQQVINFGRRTEYWINLFGHRRRGNTADDIIKPIQERVFEEAGSNPWLQKAGTELERKLDSVGDAIAKSQADARNRSKTDDD